MAKTNQESEVVPRSSEESDSDATSFSSEEELLTPAADQKKPLDPAAEKPIDSGSESDDSDSPLKSIVSKSTDDGSKFKRPRSKPNSKPAKSPAKRVAVGEKDSKKAKTEKSGEEEVKKSVLFQRLWSDDDEVAILKGMLDYKEVKGVDPMADAIDFHDFIKKLLHVDVDRKQVMDKVRRLKKRYKNSVGKKKTFNPHETIVLGLSRKIWEGSNPESTDLDLNTSAMKTRTISKAASATKGRGNVVMASPVAKNRPLVTIVGKKEEEDSTEVAKLGNPEQFIGRASVSMGLAESVVAVGLELCSVDRKSELEKKWIQLHSEEGDLFLRKLDLARQETEMIVAAIKSKGK